MRSVTRFWHKAPFVRLLIPLMAGIVLQYYVSLPLLWISLTLCVSFGFFLFYALVPLAQKFNWRWAPGVCAHILILFVGAFLMYHNDLRNDHQWFQRYYHSGQSILVRLEEPLVEKPRAYKAVATVLAVQGTRAETKGKIILYLQKDSSTAKLNYGSLIHFKKPLNEITNTGNPGSFDYKSYCLLQGTTHQVWLTASDIYPMQQQDANRWKSFTYRARAGIVHTLQLYIRSPRELGLIEAMLIGYKDDLDPDLSQSYASTGVIHIIAISGLHLALIYGLLLWLTRPLLKLRALKHVRIPLIIAALWLFSIMAGAQASVMRSAVMFTCIIGAELLNRKSYIINTLACSAFLLLCYNPCWLWDIGFQLSYLAVLSLVLFMQPIYRLVYFPNKALDYIWQMVAVTLAAQILTTPVSVYYFHQFPNLFLLTNIIAVPLSSLAVYGAIALCLFSFTPALAYYIGIAETWLISALNYYIERLGGLTIALWEGLNISLLQTILLLIAVSCIGYCLIRRRKAGAWSGLTALLLFAILRFLSFQHAAVQRQFIVYNLRGQQAVSVIEGRTEFLIADRQLLQDPVANHLTFGPAHTFYRIDSTTLLQNKHSFNAYGKRFCILNEPGITPTQQADVLVLSKRSNIYLKQLLPSELPHQVVLDASITLGKAKAWKEECQMLRIPCHSVAENGAFVMNL